MRHQAQHMRERQRRAEGARGLWMHSGKSCKAPRHIAELDRVQMNLSQTPPDTPSTAVPLHQSPLHTCQLGTGPWPSWARPFLASAGPQMGRQEGSSKIVIESHQTICMLTASSVGARANTHRFKGDTWHADQRSICHDALSSHDI